MDVPSYLLGKKSSGGGSSTLITKNISSNGTYNASSDEADGYSQVNVNVQPNLQNKQISITSNTTTTIQKDTGYDGLGTVEVTTNIPSSSGEIHDCQFLFQNDYRINELTTILPLCKPTNCESMFNSCYSLFNEKIPSLALLDVSNCTNMADMFTFCRSMSNFDLSNVVWDTSKVTDFGGMFSSCTYLENIDIRNIVTTSVTRFNYMFNGCSYLTHLDIRNLTFPSGCTYNGMFNSVPSSCEIIVKSQTEKDFILTNIRNDLANIKTVAEL